MEDRDIVASMLARDPSGLARAYDTYAGRLHAYCWSLLRDHEAAADALQDTFIVADRCIGQLRDPAKLRSWLYAIARNECLRQLRARPSVVALDEAGDVTDEAVDLDRDLDRRETRALVWAAAKGLNPSEYEVLELHLRHELDGAELADALGLSRNHAHALLSRARAQFETSLAALIVARTGRESCPDLNTLLADWDGVMDVLLRKRVNRHIERCGVCGERRRREVRPAALLSLLPFVLAPAALRSHVIELVADISHEPYRRHVADRAAPFDAAGFVRPLDRPSGSRSRALAAVAVLLLLVLGIMAGLRRVAPADPVAASMPTSTALAPIVSVTEAPPTPATPAVATTPAVVELVSTPLAPSPSAVPPPAPSSTVPPPVPPSRSTTSSSSAPSSRPTRTSSSPPPSESTTSSSSAPTSTSAPPTTSSLPAGRAG